MVPITINPTTKITNAIWSETEDDNNSTKVPICPTACPSASATSSPAIIFHYFLLNTNIS